jgi:hypothetical protein
MSWRSRSAIIPRRNNNRKILKTFNQLLVAGMVAHYRIHEIHILAIA